MRPTLSIAMIVGDAHVPCLARCLKSILDRPEGPACDELVIGWNGADTEAFVEVLADALALSEVDIDNSLHVGAPLYYRAPAAHVRVVLHPYEWKNDFADARNANFDHATGEWVMYVDADDLLVDATHPAFADSLEIDPPPQAVECYPVKGTLPEFFAALPPHINVVMAPYNYVNGDKGRPIIRKRRPRAVRWQEGHFVWASEVHEALVSAFGRSTGIWAPGLLLVHEPIIAEADRAARNTPILAAQVKRLAAEGQDAPAALLYADAISTYHAQDYAAAATKFESTAAAAAQHPEDRAMYTLLAARCWMEEGNFERAGQLALAAIDFAPLRPEGYLMASEAKYHLMDLGGCATWYEASIGKKPAEGGSLVDDRFERCLRPVSFAGVAYLRMGRHAQALAMAEAALKEATTPAALLVKREAEEGLRRQQIGAAGERLAKALLDASCGATAERVLGLLKPIAGEMSGVHKLVENARAREVSEIPADGLVRTWLGEAGNCLTMPLDAADDPEALLASVAEPLVAGDVLRVAVTDPKNDTPFTLANRMDAVDAERLLAALETHGEVTHLALVDSGESRFLTGEVKRQTAYKRTPDVTIFCPVFAEPWGPWRLLKDGMGGSEESVVYMARELSARGYNVDVYAPLDLARHRGVHIDEGVRWRPLDAFDAVKRISGHVIAQRAPWAVRLHAIDPKKLFVWHQDADYVMGWNTAIATQVKQLFVSEWQRRRLLGAVGVDTEGAGTDVGHVIGNGVPESALTVPFGERDPLSCAYVSSPVRGLANLLEIWPEVRASFPEATLRVYYGWETARTMPGMAKVQQAAMARLRATAGVEWVGRVSQHQLEQDLVKRSVWAYPVTFPEGYCNAGVRAAAAGLVPVYRRVAAMQETQYPSPFAVDDVPWAEGGRAEYLEALLGALQNSAGAYALKQREGFRDWARTKSWGVAADKLVALLEAK